MAPLWQWEAGLILQPGTCSTAQPGPAQGCYSYSPIHAVGPHFVNTHLISNIFLFYRTYSQYLEIVFSCPHRKGDKPIVGGQQEFPNSKSKGFLLGSQNSFFWIFFCLIVVDCLTTLKESSKKYQKCKDIKTPKLCKKSWKKIFSSNENAQWKIAQLFTRLDETLQLTHHILCLWIIIFLNIRRRGTFNI